MLRWVLPPLVDDEGAVLALLDEVLISCEERSLHAEAIEQSVVEGLCDAKRKELDVQQKALEWRKDFMDQAVSTESALGEMPESMTLAEADLRMFAHDMLHRDHDKDFRAFAAFPLEDLKDFMIVVVRVRFNTQVIVESLVGREYDPSSGKVLWVVIHTGHMRMA